MTKEEFAALLNGRQYREEMTKEEEKLAKELGFLVFFGASDDLLEVRGLVEDEYGAYNGTTVCINPDGTITKAPNDSRSAIVRADWSPKGLDVSWLISCATSSTFNIMEDDDLYCIGVVVDINELFEGIL